jgi:Domain of unknown function (DUF6398)
MDKQALKVREMQLCDLVVSFCTTHLNDEYAGICTRLVQKMGRKKQIPFELGKLEVWAAATIHAVGTINFLFDKKSEPHSTLDEINDFFKTNKTTTGNKSKEIRNMFKMTHFDKEFSTKSMAESSPFSQFVMVDGFIVPLDSLPENIQLVVKEARARGVEVSLSSPK